MDALFSTAAHHTPRGRATRVLLVFLIMVCTGPACDRGPVGPDPDPDPPPLDDPTKPSDEYLIWFAYHGDRFPDGFYHEEVGEGAPYYLNTVSVAPTGAREPVWIELCTDDLEQAKEWSELSSRYSAYYRDLVSQRETEKYFEFKRVYSVRPTDILLSRAHKCSYYDASSRDLFLDPPTLGTLNKRPLVPSVARELIEYLWFFQREGPGEKVLHSATTEAAGLYRHAIYSVRIVYGDWGMYDQISLRRFTYTVHATTGEVLRTARETLRTVQGRYHPNAFPG